MEAFKILAPRQGEKLDEVDRKVGSQGWMKHENEAATSDMPCVLGWAIQQQDCLAE